MEVRPATPPVAPPAAVPVFCKDCKHFDPAPKYRPVCMAPQARTIHLVHGYQNPECERARCERRGGACGSAGELFVQASKLEGASAVAGVREPYAKKPNAIPAPAYSPNEISHEAPSALRHAQWGYEDLTNIAKAQGRQSSQYKQYCDITLERIRPRLELILLAAIPALQCQAQTAHRQTSRNATTSAEQSPVSEPRVDLLHETQD